MHPHDGTERPLEQEPADPAAVRLLAAALAADVARYNVIFGPLPEDREEVPSYADECRRQQDEWFARLPDDVALDLLGPTDADDRQRGDARQRAAARERALGRRYAEARRRLAQIAARLPPGAAHSPEARLAREVMSRLSPGGATPTPPAKGWPRAQRGSWKR